jgi:hypothetical protein
VSFGKISFTIYGIILRWHCWRSHYRFVAIWGNDNFINWFYKTYCAHCFLYSIVEWATQNFH